jgi:hypothetical protein
LYPGKYRIEGGRLARSGFRVDRFDGAFVVERAGLFAVLRVPGYQEWAGLHMERGYVPAEWSLVELVEDPEGYVVVERVVRSDRPGKRWHQVRRELVAEMKKRAAEAR